ncbi:MAG TPA: hypothetical protein VEX15_02265 [Nocardioidaceae bacterium]|nr:hypothetical protein [Nocardioidaceae bacterium]
MLRLSSFLGLVAGGASLVAGLTVPASGSVPHPGVVSEDAANGTPQLVATGAVGQPRTDALTQLDDTVYAGGWFDRASQGGNTYDRHNIVAFDADSGAVRSFNPTLTGRVWALASDGDSIYIGGKFGRTNGISRPNLVKVDATTGAVDTAFNARITGGRVNALVVANGRLYVGGAFTKKLTAVNLDTGADTGTFDLAITDQLPNSWGTVAVYAMAINRAGTQLVATGDFRTVAGQPRSRLFVANLGATATLSSWYYEGFTRPCSSTNPRRIAYLQGVDFSPDGSYFLVVATGQISRTADLGETVCDGAGRFDLDDDSQPAWINYTGGDSLWSVAATGPAVYVQGHHTYLDNEGGWQNHPIPTAVVRRGIGAINPTTGRALAWNPSKPASVGGKAFLATQDGLWVGSDSQLFNGDPHRGIAFCPLP